MVEDEGKEECTVCTACLMLLLCFNSQEDIKMSNKPRERYGILKPMTNLKFRISENIKKKFRLK